MQRYYPRAHYKIFRLSILYLMSNHYIINYISTSLWLFQAPIVRTLCLNLDNRHAPNINFEDRWGLAIGILNLGEDI